MNKFPELWLRYSLFAVICLYLQCPALAQHSASHRLILLPTASALPERVTLGVHALIFPPTLVPQVTIPFGSSFGTFIYLGGGGFQDILWAVGSVAAKYTPFSPDSSRFGFGVVGQVTAGGLAASGVGAGGGAIPTFQIVASSPVSRIQVHGGFAIHPAVGSGGWYTPFLGMNFAALQRLHVLAEFFTFAPVSGRNQPTFGWLGLRLTTDRATYDVGTGLQYRRSSRYEWIPPIVAMTFKL